MDDHRVIKIEDTPMHRVSFEAGGYVYRATDYTFDQHWSGGETVTVTYEKRPTEQRRLELEIEAAEKRAERAATTAKEADHALLAARAAFERYVHGLRVAPDSFSCYDPGHED